MPRGDPQARREYQRAAYQARKAAAAGKPVVTPLPTSRPSEPRPVAVRGYISVVNKADLDSLRSDLNSPKARDYRDIKGLPNGPLSESDVINIALTDYIRKMRAMPRFRPSKT